MGRPRAAAPVAQAAKVLASRDVPVAFRLATLWEVAIKTSLGRPGFAVDPALLHRAMLDEGFVELTITAPHVLRVANRPWVHRGSFDRLLVAQPIEVPWRWPRAATRSPPSTA